MLHEASKGKEQTVWIVRHAERIDFIDSKWRSTAERPDDPYLSDKGFAQAQKLAGRLVDEGIGLIFASPFLRTLQTALPVARALDLPIKIEYGLCEWLNPQWFSAAPSYLSATDIPHIFSWVDTNYTSLIQPTYPETWPDLEKRTEQIINLLVTRYPGNIVLIGHGATVVGTAQGLLPGKPKINTNLCGLVAVAQRENGWSLVLNGDTSYLQNGQNSPKHAWI
jgi:broad specificity phosphatase PhoE